MNYENMSKSKLIEIIKQLKQELKEDVTKSGNTFLAMVSDDKMFLTEDVGVILERSEQGPEEDCWIELVGWNSELNAYVSRFGEVEYKYAQPITMNLIEDYIIGEEE